MFVKPNLIMHKKIDDHHCTIGKWIIPNISGQCCPPTSGFAIQNINSSKAVMFGGRVTEGGVSVPNSNMYICEVNHYTIVSLFKYIYI